MQKYCIGDKFFKKIIGRTKTYNHNREVIPLCKGYYTHIYKKVANLTTCDSIVLNKY